MLTARWTLETRFGHRSEALALMRRWWREIAPQIGWQAPQARLRTVAVGARESRVEVDVAIADLAALDAAWARLGALPAQQAWAQALEPHVVSGSAGWQVLREVTLDDA